MCFGAEAAWVPAVIAAVSAGATGAAQGQALKRQDREAAANILKQGQANREAGQRVNKTVQELKTSTPDDAAAQRREAYTAALRKAQPAAESAALPTFGGASMRFAEDVGAARSASAASGAEDADIMARLDAPGLQRQAEAQRAAGAASDISLTAGRAGGENALSRIRSAGIQPNPWLMAAGQVGQGFASGMAAGGGAGGLGSAAANPAGGLVADNGTSIMSRWVRERGIGLPQVRTPGVPSGIGGFG